MVSLFIHLTLWQEVLMRHKTSKQGGRKILTLLQPIILLSPDIQPFLQVRQVMIRHAAPFYLPLFPILHRPIL